MDAERFSRLRSLFEAVHDLPPNERIGYLHTQGADAELIAEVLTLLDASASHNTAQFARPLQAALAAEVPQVLAGDQLGVWRIEREIAQGGMGSVYEVKRADGHFAQTAALKFIKGRQGLGAQAAFARERQLLATLAHPQIARLLDGGANAQGYPYLVMELVDGVPIDQYCREHALPTRRVLDLFVSACDAVAFAHRQLIIHCDLKPSNLLVTTDARPMLLDFGIAQLLSGVADTDSAHSDAAQPKPRAFTPRYASPEQQRGERLTTTSDIFSLGVMLRVLLALQPERGRSAYELDAICTKATHADPLQRYPTVEALCADIDRFRTMHPVQALPATFGYWLRKLLLRRWLAVLVGAGFIAMALVFTARVTSESQRALAAEKTAVATRDRALKAEAEALASEASAVQVSEFLISVFDGANPDAQTGTVVTSVLVDAALERVARDLTDQPATQSQMYAALGAVLYTIEQPQRGLETYRRAIEIERTQSRPLVLARMLIDSAIWRLRHFNGADAIPDAREGLQLVERHSAPDAVLLLDALHTVARLISGSGDPAEGSALLARALPIARRIAPDSERLKEVLGTVAWHERALGNYDRAIALMQEQIALDARLNGADRVEHAGLLSALAGTLGLANRYTESEAVFKRAIAQRRAHNAIDNRDGAWLLAEYARMLGNAGRPLAALPIYAEVLAIADRKLAADGAARAVWLGNSADVAAQAGDFVLAEQRYAEAIAMAEKRWGPNGEAISRMQMKYGRLLMDTGQIQQAQPWLQRARTNLLTATGPGEDLNLLAARIEYARGLIAAQQPAAAKQELAIINSQRAKLPAPAAARLDHTEAQLQLLMGDINAALTQFAAAEQAMLAARGAADARSWLLGIDRAELLLKLKRGAESRQLAATILKNVADKLDPDSPLLVRLRVLANAD